MPIGGRLDMLWRWQLEQYVETVDVGAEECGGGKLGPCLVVVQCEVEIAGFPVAVVVVDADVVIGHNRNDVVDMVVTG